MSTQRWLLKSKDIIRTKQDANITILHHLTCINHKPLNQLYYLQLAHDHSTIQGIDLDSSWKILEMQFKFPIGNDPNPKFFGL